MPDRKIDVWLRDQPDDVRALVLQHIYGLTSANYMSEWFKKVGLDVSPTAIKEYRTGARG